MQLALPPGKYQVKTALLEESSGKMSTRREDFEVDPASPEVPYISSVVLSRAAVPDQSLSPAAYNPFRLGKTVIVPSFTESFPQEGLLTAFFHVYNLGTTDSTSYRLQMSIAQGDDIVSRSEPRDARSDFPHPLNGYLFAPRLSLADLPEGTYRLEVEIVLPDGSKRVTRSVPFHIE